MCERVATALFLLPELLLQYLYAGAAGNKRNEFSRAEVQRGGFNGCQGE